MVSRRGRRKYSLRRNIAAHPLGRRSQRQELYHGQTHNYAFTTEIHTSFTYKGGEIFSFQGDDDVFTYVDNKLVIDLGGVHTVQSATIDFDKYADILGLVKGQTYNMDIFHAERHTTQSNFKMQTKFDCLVSRIIP
jgi:fibro-slime domain-containing protein